ncbi:MAG: hypothetical protein KOO60_06870 [Gemmatimonadales bacterium]|nr:hypothetical protein [Gemmatimonadales bacterium]
MAVKPVVFSLLPYMWRAWWRKLEQRGVWHGANTGMVMALAFLSLIAVLIGSLFAFKVLRSDAVNQGIMILEFCLNTILLSWLFIPIMVGSTTAEGRGLQPVRLGQFPLGIGHLLAIGLLGRLIQPVYWILTGASLCVLLPLSAMAQPIAGLAAGILFLVFSALLAWSVELFGGAFFSSRHGREMVMVGVLLIMIPMLILLNGDYSFADDALTFSMGEHSWLLLSMDGSEGLLVRVRVLSPSLWVTGAGQGGAGVWGIILLALAVGLSAVTALLSLRRVMVHPPGSLSSRKSGTRAIGTLRWLPAQMGPLVIKEMRYLTRTLDHMLGVGTGLAALVWILLRPEHISFVLPLAAVMIVFNESAIPLNNFGLDGPGADRYRLLPLSGRQVLLTKNLAYFGLVGIQIIPLVVAGILKGGLLLALSTVLGVWAACLVTAAGGNVASIRSPAPRAFFNFESKEQTGGALALILAGLVWVVPAGVYFAMMGIGEWAVALGMFVLLTIAGLIYWSWLRGAGISFEESGEMMRARLTKE